MKTAYLYVRVSTDEQKRKGYSLPEQEDRLLKYCEYNDIKVKGIYREDFSAKSFNRPEWTKLVSTIKRCSTKDANSILFVKWDRFSRNVEYAYEMIGILRKYNTLAKAIDQPIDLDIPESAVMLAVYLAIPQAENGRRSLNTSNGMRRAKQMGRHPNKAPLGYVNLTASDGKKYIEPMRDEASLIQWAFEKLAKNVYRIEEVRRMVNLKGLKCSKSNFWKLIHNPIYCGYISLMSNTESGKQLIRGIHEPIISEELYHDVQNIIHSKKKVISKGNELNEMFILRKYLICTSCGRGLSGSFSQGKAKRYPYYHCSRGCKTRFKAELLNKNYENKLHQFMLLPAVTGLFNIVLEDVNVSVSRDENLQERKLLLKQIENQNNFISKARKLFVNEKIQYDDFYVLKKEYQAVSCDLKDELEKVTIKLRCIDMQLNLPHRSLKNIFEGFDALGVIDKKHLVDFVPPTGFDERGLISIHLNSALSKILSTNI